MAYIKIYDKKLMPIGIIDIDSIEVQSEKERYVKIKDANGIINGVVNIDEEITSSEIARLVTLYNDNMQPIGVADIEDVVPQEHDYSKDYFTTEALGDGTISFNIWVGMGTDLITSISYSKDNGETWTTVNNENNKEENLQIEVDVEEGDKILWKGTAQQLGYYDEDEDNGLGSFFSSTCEFNAYGNVMSMLYGDNFSGRKTLSYDWIFARLFNDYNGEQTCSIKNASNVSLPATTLAQCCYSGMFSGCTSLTVAPELPATVLADNCYYAMFSGCTSLTVAPELPATTLTYNCYGSMFEGCTSLTTAPELPATTLTEGCYSGMFSGCTSLTVAPELPATVLADNCYYAMFSGCTSLTTAPELPATTLVIYCYYRMFSGCTSLNYIKCLATNINADKCTDNWVINVAATGTFVKADSMSSWNTGINGIPSGWTVVDA